MTIIDYWDMIYKIIEISILLKELKFKILLFSPECSVVGDNCESRSLEGLFVCMGWWCFNAHAMKACIDHAISCGSSVADRVNNEAFQTWFIRKDRRSICQTIKLDCQLCSNRCWWSTAGTVRFHLIHDILIAVIAFITFKILICRYQTLKCVERQSSCPISHRSAPWQNMDGRFHSMPCSW